MLDGSYLWDIPDSVVDLWEELEDWAIEDIIERILMTDKKNQTKTGATAVYRFDLLSCLGMDMKNVYTQLSEYTKKSEKELKDIFIDAGAKCLENDNMVYLQHGIKDALTGSNQWVRQLMESMYQKTCGEMRNFTGTFAKGYQKTVLELMDRAYVETITGMKSHAEAVADVIDDLGRIGITSVEYDKGHRDMVETAVRRAVLTGVNRTAMQISLENAKRLGADYVVISSHLGARVAEDKIANHAGWQGKIYKIEGSDKTAPNLREETGYPDNPLGLGGYNCRHNIFPYFPGDPNPFERFNKTENEKAYRLSQQQRAKERAIRKSKRQLLALSKGMEAAPDEATKAALQERYDKASFLYAKRNNAYNQFCEDNDLKPKAERLRIAKWNRSQAGMANAGARRYILEKQAGLKKAVKIPEDCTYLLCRDTNFESRDIDPAVLRSINNAIEKIKERYKDFDFDEIKIAEFARGDKSVFITNYQQTAGKSKVSLYMNKQYLLNHSLGDLNKICAQYSGNGWWCSERLEDLIKHEIMHARICYYNSFDKAEQLYQYLQEDSRTKGLCRLVDKEPSEFLNEMFVLIENGKKIDEKYMKVYNEYSGKYLRR